MSSGIYSSSLLLSEDSDHAVLGVASDSLSESSESESSEEDEAFEYSGDDGDVASFGDCAGVDETDAIRFW